MHISSKADYAMRACIELARDESNRPIPAEVIALRADLPTKFLESILLELRHAQLVRTTRGPNGGCRLSRPATQISAAEIVRAVDGPLCQVRGLAPETLEYPEHAQDLARMWVAVRAAARDVLEQVTLAQLAAGELPPVTDRYLELPGAWTSR
jgi:Rrf2 family protein